MTKPYKRFLLFSHADYYPSGGLTDVRHEFSTVEEFDEFIVVEDNRYSLSDTWYLFDCEARDIVRVKPD